MFQEICDHHKFFLDLCVLAHGGSHNALHLKKSYFHKILLENAKLQEPILLIEGRDLKLYVVGDTAYLLLQQLLRAYNARLSNKEG